MRVKCLLIAGIAPLIVAGCGGASTRRHRVPDVRGERLDVAEHVLRNRGLHYDELGGGTFGILVRSHWEVCKQQPAPGKRATKVLLVVDRDCYDDWDD